MSYCLIDELLFFLQDNESTFNLPIDYQDQSDTSTNSMVSILLLLVTGTLRNIVTYLTFIN